MAALPSGTVTFLFTDVEGSTTLLDALGTDAYASAHAGHLRRVREAFESHRGVEINTHGDAVFVAFESAREAAAAAAAAQTALAAGPIRVRMGMHTGEALLTDQSYVGMDVHRAARIAAVAHGGQVLLSQTTRELLDQSVAVTDLGEHRLKDLSAPERLYQLGTKRFPPLRSLYRTNLPIPATPFLDRETELGKVGALLAQEEVRLVTLTGPGGTGKTRLALQAAAAASDSYPDGVWWVPLAPVRDPALVLEAAREALGAPTGLSEQIDDRSLLLLFDNFEQVVEAAADVGSLLAAHPNLNVLVTSRESLHLSGEHEYAVPTLRHDEATALFAARAAGLPRSFRQSSEVAEICHRLDYLPLAVELAAARTRALSPRQILERLETRLPLLTGGPRDAPERQQTLRATIEWSYELLSDEEQKAFSRLAVFSGGCTLEAAEQVCDARLDTLQSLVEKSLIRYTNERYWMLATIREYASQQLANQHEYDSRAAAHAEYFAAVAGLAESHFVAGDETTWIKLLVEDLDNLRGALAYSDGAPRQLRLAAALWRFWERQADYGEGRLWLAAALGHREGAPTTHIATALLGAGELARLQGDLDEAERLTTESVAIAQGAGLRVVEARAVGALGNVALARRDFRRSEELLAKTETLFRELADEKLLAVTLNNRAYLALQLENFEAAFALAEESRGLSRKTGDRALALSAGLNLSLAARSLERKETARQALQEALELARDVGHIALVTVALIISAAHVASDDPAAASALIAVADRARQELKLELDPVERDLRAAVVGALGGAPQIELSGDAAGNHLLLSLEAATVRALDALAALDRGSRT